MCLSVWPLPPGKGSTPPYLLHPRQYIILSWSGYVGVDLTPFAKLNAFTERVKAMPKVAEAHAAMNAAA